MTNEPSANARRLVRAVVIQNEVDVRIARYRVVDGLEKSLELATAMAAMTFTDDCAGRDVTRGKQRRRAVATIVSAADIAVGRGQFERRQRRRHQGLDLRGGAFALQTRTASYRVRFDGQTQILRGSTRVRAASLKDGQVVSIRGSDYGSYVQALVISIRR